MTDTVRTRPVLGVLAVDRGSDGRLQWGPLAGRVGWQAMDEWKSGVCVVMAADISPRMRAELGLRHPAERVAEGFVHTRTAVAMMPVVAIHESLWAPLAALGCRLVRVAYHRGSSSFQLETEGPSWPAVRMDTYLHTLWGEGGLTDDDLDIIDRLLRAATMGAVTEHAVRAADCFAKQIDSVLIEAGAPEKLAESERVRAELRRECANDPIMLEGLGDDSPATEDFSDWEKSHQANASWGESYRAVAEALAQALASGGGPQTIDIEEPARRTARGVIEGPSWQRYTVRRTRGGVLEVEGRDAPVHLRIPASALVLRAR